MITNYGDLKFAVESGIARDDTPSWIYHLANAEINQRLRIREMEVTAGFAISSGVPYVTLPTRFLMTRHVYVGADGTTDQLGGFSDGFSEGFEVQVPGTAEVLAPLEQTSGFQMSVEFSDSGKPRQYALQGSKIRLNPVPDTDYDGVWHYVASLADFADFEDTNTILTTFPTIYLYAALKHAAVWAQDLEIAAVYGPLFDTEIERITRRDRANRHSGPLRVRLG